MDYRSGHPGPGGVETQGCCWTPSHAAVLPEPAALKLLPAPLAPPVVLTHQHAEQYMHCNGHQQLGWGRGPGRPAKGNAEKGERTLSAGAGSTAVHSPWQATCNMQHARQDDKSLRCSPADGLQRLQSSNLQTGGDDIPSCKPELTTELTHKGREL
jgi:hypothetical protein